MKQQIDENSTRNAPNNNNNLLPVTCAIKTHHLLEKFATAAVSGEYVDFSDVLSSLCSLQSPHSNEEMLQSLSGDLISIARPQRMCLVDSNNVWLQVWTNYEMEIILSRPGCWEHMQIKMH